MAESQWVVFTMGREQYGVEITSVREIITMQKVTPLPGMPEYAEGVTHLRDHVIPVIDLKRRLGLPNSERDHETRIMLVEVGATHIGCIVDGVRSVIRTTDDMIKEPPAGIGHRAKGVVGIVSIDGELVILVDLQAVLQSAVTAA